LVVHIPGARDAIRDFTNEAFFFGGVDRSSQGDSTITGDDLHVAGVHGHLFPSTDFLADLGGGVSVRRTIALFERR
jgi:hypothetical protein